MYLSEDIKTEIEYFKKLHESFSVLLGEKNVSIISASDEVLYMLFSASLVMDIAEDELFDNFIITAFFILTSREKYGSKKSPQPSKYKGCSDFIFTQLSKIGL